MLIKKNPQARLDLSSPHPPQSMLNHLPAATDTEQHSIELRICLKLIEKLSGPGKIVAQVMLATGCRASEVLSLTVGDISNTGHIFIRARKSSVQRIVYCPLLVPYAYPRKYPLSHKIFGHYSYFKFYRSLIRLYPGSFPRSAVRQKVSNLFRCAAAQISRSFDGSSPLQSQIFLGHKSPRSTAFYLQSRGKPNG